MAYTPKPYELANFDQSYAEANQHVDHLIVAYQSERAESGERPEVDLAGLATFLNQDPRRCHPPTSR